MKLESEKEVKLVHSLISTLKKMKLDNLSVPEGYELIYAMEWLVKACNDFKDKPKDPVIAGKVTSIETAKGKHVRSK